MIPGLLAAIAVFSYLLGGLNGAIIASKYVFHRDVRDYGSGNAGLTNFYRTFGAPGLAIVIGTDVLKTVIAVVAGKGGTGKTSFTTLTGMALAQLGKKTLLLDCDIGLRNLDLYLGVSDRALMDFTDVIAGRTTLAQAVVRHPLYPNLYLLTAPVSFGVRLPSKREMQRLIDEIRRHFDFCLIDAAAGIGEAFALATCCADRAVVVTTNDPSSLRDAQRTVMELHRFPSGYLHLVVNRVRRKLLQSLHTTIDDAIDAAGLPLLGVIPEDENVPAVLGRGLSQRLKYRSGALCACENIARRLCGERVRLMRL